MTPTPASEAQAFANEPFCYLTTTGRVTGRAHTVEIWFALDGATIFMLSGNLDRADWVKNALRQPKVAIKLADRLFEARARIVEAADEDKLARRLLRDKYSRPDNSLDEWASTALPMAFDLVCP